jgi:hypothetical protein
MKSIAVLIAVALAVGAVVYAAQTGTWPTKNCHSSPPFGPHDFTCVYTIGR